MNYYQIMLLTLWNYRNRITHNYESINKDKLYEFVSSRTPYLAEVLERLIERMIPGYATAPPELQIYSCTI